MTTAKSIQALAAAALLGGLAWTPATLADTDMTETWTISEGGQALRHSRVGRAARLDRAARWPPVRVRRRTQSVPSRSRAARARGVVRGEGVPVSRRARRTARRWRGRRTRACRSERSQARNSRCDAVTIVTPNGQTTPAGVVPRLKQMTVVGTFDAGHYEYDSGLALLHLDDAARLFRTEGPTGVQLRLADQQDARRVAAELSVSLGEGVVVRDWTRTNRN